MKKLLTIFALLVAFVTQGYATENIVWTGSEAISWNTDVAPGTQYETPDGTFTGLKKGDTIRVYTTTTYDEPQYVMTYKKGDGWDWTDLTTSFSEGVLSYTVDDETTAKEIAERGLIFRGQAYTITKITVETPSSSYEGTVIYNGGDVVMGTDWDKYIQLSADKFTDLNPGAVIRIYIKDVLDDVQAVFQNGSWQDIEGVDAVYPSATDTYYELTLTSSVLDVVKESGLIIKGKNFTATAVSIVSTGTAVTKYTLTITQPETGGKIKNGDADAATAEYKAGTVVTLTATPDDGYEFEKWTDGTNDLTAESDGSLKVTMDGDKAVTASFRSITVVTPVFTDGAADLSKFEVQDAEKVTYDAETHKITVTEGWTGVQITATSADDVQGKELRITFSEDAKVKASVKYADDSATDSIMSEAAAILYMEIDGTKKVSQIQIQPTEAGSVTLSEVVVNAESTKPAEPEPETPVFTDGAADLSKFEVQDAEKVTYDADTHTITVTEGWTGVQITATSADDVQGKELRITFSEAAKVKATVKYADDSATDSIMSEAAAILYMEIDGTKKVSQIQIQPTEAGSVTLSEVIVNAESTKPAEPEPEPETPVFTDGAADLSKFEVQDAEKVTYDAETHKITVTEGWTGVQITATSADDVQGKELRITFSEAAKVKATVKYADDTATDSIMSEAAAILYMEIDGTKKVSQIQIQPTEAGSITLSEVVVNAESTKPVEPEPEPETPVFTDGAADLSKFEVQDAEKVTYDATTHTITVTEGWTGVQITATSADDVQGKELRITFSEDAKVKATVKYADDSATDSIMSEAAAILYMEIDGTKKVSQIQIQPTEAGSVTLSEVIVNAESTKPAEPEPETPVFTDGAADLSKFEVQDAEKVTYDADTHTITVTEGWTGVQITATSADDVQGKELRITFSEAAKVKASVKYADDSATDSIMSEAAAILYMEIDGTKKVSQIQIQPTEAGSVTLSEVIVNAESTKPADPEPEPETPAFTDGAADLSKFEVQDAEKVTYDAETHTITVTEGWTGVQITATSADDVQGKELRITFSEAAKVKATVKYADDTATDSIMSEAAAILYMEIDGTKKVSQIQIQPTEAGSVTLSEVVVNAESTKPAEPDPETPVFTDGAADLSKFEVQDAEKVTYDTTTHTITVTEGWTGVQITATSADDVQGKELRITFSEAAKVKATVKYADDSATDSIMSEAAAILYMEIDGTKKVSQIQIQPTEAGSVTLSEVVVNAESTKPADPEPETPVFTDGAADLSKFEVQDAEKVTYDATTHTITVTEGWTGVQITATSADDVQGKELRITFSEAAKVKATVKYADDTATDSIMSEASTILYMEIDGTKKVSQIQIQPTEAGSITLSEVVVNAESTKPAEPEPEPETPVFTDGAADLSKFEVQDAEKVTYDAETHKITVTEGWTGVQITATSADDVQGKELRITFSEAAKVKASVKYADDSATDSIMSEAAAILYMEIDGTKKISQIQIQPTEAGSVILSEVIVNAESTKPADPEPEPTQTGVNITLDDLNEGWNSTYDATTKTISITDDWGARGWYIGDNRYNDKGSITVKYNAVDFPVTLKMEYKNTSDESKDTSTGASAGETEVTLDIPENVKTIEKVYITYEKAADLVLTAATVNDKVVDNRTEKTLVEKSQAIAEGDITINRGLFSNAVAGDILRIYATGLGDGSKIALEPADYSGALDGANWTSFTESPFSLKLTATLLETLKAKNLLVRGESYTFTKATLYTENELGEAISDGGDEEEDDISNENASENTKKLYSVLKDLYGKKIVSGVVANVDWNTKEAENVYGWTGKWPAMNVYDFINIHASKDVNAEGWVDYSDISSAKAWWKKGGIVGAMWHWQMKANNGTDYTCTPGTAAGETSFDASRILVDGTSENTLAKKQLDQVCGYLAKMQDAGIPVVWRPLHEASGNVEQYTGGTAWFWWGAKGADTYKKLWQWMYNYMVKTKGLNNLIWVWTSQTNDEDWYPGDAYVDIIGRDNYGATAAKLATEYEKLKESYPNKMITLAECGNSDDAEMAAISNIWDAGSRWSWFMTWYDGDYNDGKTTTHKHTSKAWWTNAVGKDYVVTRDQMKELLGQDDSGDEITGVNITLDDLNEGWSSTYDATTKTITTTGEWAARGWYIGDDRYNSKGSITVKYKAVDFGVTLKMEYTNTNGESKSVSTGAAAGETEVVLDIPTDVKTIEKVYITYQPVGKLVLTAVTVNNKVVDNRTEKTLVEKSQAIADGDIKINRGLFSNAVAGDAIRIYGTGLSDASKIALEPADYSGALDGANWTAFTESPFVLKLTAATLATIQGKGLLVRGEKFTFTKAVLYTEKNLGAEIADDNGNDNNDDNGDDSGDDKGDDKEDNIFDSETGETDLSEMKGQDSATTVTANNDGSITMTTTEPYKAAQIWFNTPEKVTGNVLKVEIAETGINVTVTVRYTDGSESSMATSANAASRRAGANTRSESKGTQINVPLETGKDVQSIEVKNAEAGTITIKKMSMTSMNIFANGKADLTMLKSQSNATYDTSTYTLATTKGWTGVTLTPLSTESVSGKELLVRFTNTTKVKLAVAYRDATETDMIMSEAGTAARLSLDNTKVINQITIQPTEASIITFTEIAVNAQATTDPVVPIFVDGKADLSKFSVQDASKCFYDSESYTIRVVEGWTGVQLLLGTGQQVSGEELTIRFDGNARVKASVSYTDDENVSVIMEDADNLVRLELDKSKLINKIEIQPTEAGSVKLKEVSISDQRDTSGLMMEGKMLELWTSEDGEVLSWNEVARQTKKVGSQLQEFDEILITVQGVTEGSEWPKVFLRDAYSNQVGNVVELHDVTEYPHIARIVLNSSMAEQMKQGFSICGDGITVTRLQAYRPYAPKEGDIHLSALDYGYNSSYDNVSYTVTTTSRWAARGWKIGDMRYNSKDVVIVRFQPADFPVTLKMEYIDADGYSQATSVGVAAGCAEVSMPIPADIQRLDYVYLIFQEPGSLVLTDALVVTNAEAKTRGIDIPNGDTTGINGIEVNGTDDGWYNLHGVRVEKPGKGVYIRNGKKIVIR